MAAFEMMKTKWRRMFVSLDTNEDGYMSEQDLLDLAQKFIDKYELSHSQSVQLRFAAILVSNMLLDTYGDKNRHVTIDEWIDMFASFCLRKPEVLKDRIHTFYSTVFEILDMDKDGFISLDEFKFFYWRFGKDEANLQLAFNALDQNRDGKISQLEYVTAYTRYVTDPDLSADELPLF